MGGFPCQDISIANVSKKNWENGKVKGINGERSGLWKQYKRMIMNEVRKLYNNDGCVLKEASSNDYESWSSARTLGPMERRKEYRNLCYNFEYEWGTNIPHCAKKGVCDEDCEYMRNFKE